VAHPGGSDFSANPGSDFDAIQQVHDRLGDTLLSEQVGGFHLAEQVSVAVMTGDTVFIGGDVCDYPCTAAVAVGKAKDADGHLPISIEGGNWFRVTIGRHLVARRPQLY